MSINATKISVIIPVFNREKYITDLIQSVLKQSIKEIEVICIDDGSSDNTLLLLQNIAKRNSRVHILTKENGGAGTARNIGILHAKGKFIFFLDSDDKLFDENALQYLFEAAEKNNANICGGNIVFGYPNRMPYIDAKYVFPEGKLNYEDYQFDCYFSRFLYKTAFLRDNGLFFPEIRNYEDPVFLLKAMLASKWFYYVNKDIYYYNRQHIETSRLSRLVAIDGLTGITENLILSSKNDLRNLHVRVYQYLLFFSHKYIERLLYDDSAELFSAMIKCTNAVEIEWVKEAGIPVCEPLILPEMNTIIRASSKYLKLLNNPIVRVINRIRNGKNVSN